MDTNKDFEKAREKEIQERWFLRAQLPKEGRAELNALEQKHKEDLDWMKRTQEMGFEKDTEKEFHRLLEKEALQLHNRPIGMKGNLLSEDHFKKLAQHNVIVQNRETLKRMEHQQDNAINALLNKEGLFMSKGNTQINLPDHFNERGLSNSKNHGQDHSRGR